MAALLALAGATVALYCLWQLRRWLAEGEAASAAVPRRLEKLVDELLATAEATSVVVQEKAEALETAIAEADRRLAQLNAAALPPAALMPEPFATPPVSAPAAAVPAVATVELPLPPAWEPAPEPAAATVAAPAAEVDVLREAGPSAVPALHREVYMMADSGLDVTAIARRLSLTKGEVQLILGLRHNG